MRKRDRILFIFGVILFLSEIWKQFCLTYIVNSGAYDWWYFPFQLCSIPIYISLLLPFVRTEAVHGAMLTFLMDFGMLGGIFAFFDTSGMHYPYFPLTIHSYLWHILLIVIGITAGLLYRASSRQDYKNSVWLYLSCCALANIFNICFDSYGTINMFYINPDYHMTQIVFSDIADVLGNPAGILIYIGASILGSGIIHLLWEKVCYFSCR